MCTLLLTSTMETKVTSKTSSLKALILRAWRERWSDLQWGINIKTILPRGVSGDVYNLADCILQQALVGPGPNHLVLSYLKHSLSSQLVSYAAVLQRISKYDAFHKPHCIICLLEFLESIQVGITCRGKPEEDLLAAAVLSIVHWLLQCYLHTLTKMQQNSLTTQTFDLIEKPASILKQMLSSDFLCAMMYLAKHDDKDLYQEVVKKCQEIESLHKTSGPKTPSPIEESLKKLCNLEIEIVAPNSINLPMESITYCLQPLFAVQVLLSPCTETSVFVNQMLMIQRLKGYTNARLYSEIMRACLMSLHNVTGTVKESQWGAVTFLKVPFILKELHATTLTAGQDDKFEYSQDILDAFELLLQFTPLLDVMDATCSCNSIECLLDELKKVNLVTEKHVKQLSSKREGVAEALQKLEDSSSPTSSIMQVIVRAEPTLAGILKTLNADYTKIQDALLSMLCQVLNGKSLDLMLAVATVEGQLKNFVTKLIKFNECSKQLNEPSVGKTGPGTRAMLFDISFLILCNIVQIYGSDIVLEEGGDSFFEQWIRECMPERDKPKSPQKMLQNVDSARVDALLAQLNSPEPDFKAANVKWHVMCQSAMGAVKELLCAWESEVLDPTEIKHALDGLKSAAGCLPVCAASWLCAHMSITQQDALLKPMNMVQHLMTALPVDDQQQDNFKSDTAHLMCSIIKRIQYDVHLPNPSKTKASSTSHGVSSRQLILEQFESVWQDIHQRGWVTIQSTHTLELILNTGGSLWFVSNLVREALKYKYQEELDRAIDLVFAIFHLDIENCTLDLINHILPQYLYNAQQCEELVEPQSSELAKLCVYCILSTLEHNNSNPQRGNNRKRTRRDLESDEIEAICGPANKLLRLNDNGDSTGIFGSNSPQAQGSSNGQNIVLRDPFLTALNGLLTTFNYLAGRDGEVSQQTHFILQFLRIMVQCGKDRTRIVLQGMPQTLVPCLLKALPELFTTDLLLRLYDIQTAPGRKATARDLCMLRNITLKPPK